MGIRYFYNFCLRDDGALDGDILSGVRKSYFADQLRIRDKITAGSDCDPLMYEYSIEKGKPMRWSVKAADGALLEESSNADEGRYYIRYYRDTKIIKRLTFSKLHTLLKCEYFDPVSGEVSATLEPRKAKSGLCILYTASASPQPVVLYSMPGITDEKLKDRIKNYIGYTVIASTDEGLVKFMSMNQIEHFRSFVEYSESKLSEVREESFIEGETPLYDRISAKDFNIKRNLSTALDITKAAEFSAVKYDEPDETEIIAEENEAEAEAYTEPAGITSDVISAEPEESEREETAVYPAPDKLIPADGEVYSYYGELDLSGNRSGYGRTVTPSGHTAYEGGYLNDKRSGKGAYYYKDGSLCYAGEWTENVRHGVGVGISSSDGSIHAGRWSLNRPEGNGARLTADGDIRFVCKELSDGTTVLMNFSENDTILVSKYDSEGMKIGEKSVSLKDILN